MYVVRLCKQWDGIAVGDLKRRAALETKQRARRNVRLRVHAVLDQTQNSLFATTSSSLRKSVSVMNKDGSDKPLCQA